MLPAARFRIALETPDSPLAGLPRTAGAPDGERPGRLEVNGVRLDLDGCRVFANGAEVALTRAEYELLRVLLENAGMLLSRRELLHIIRRPGDMDHNTTLDARVRRLRHKLDPGSPAPRIRAIRGVGYIFDTAPESDRATARS